MKQFRQMPLWIRCFPRCQPSSSSFLAHNGIRNWPLYDVERKYNDAFHEAGNVARFIVDVSIKTGHSIELNRMSSCTSKQISPLDVVGATCQYCRHVLRIIINENGDFEWRDVSSTDHFGTASHVRLIRQQITSAITHHQLLLLLQPSHDVIKLQK